MSNDASARIGSYTTARVSQGRVERTERHVRRLQEDASRLGLPPPEGSEVERALVEAAGRAFPRRDGIIRIEWSRRPREEPALHTTTRPLGEDDELWRARVSRAVHPGPGERANTKSIGVEAYEIGREEIRSDPEIQEVLLCDANGHLVEGARSNLLIELRGARLVTPDPQLGAVAGLGLAIARECLPELGEIRIRLGELDQVRAIAAINVVRGVVPIASLSDGSKPDLEARPWLRLLREVFGRPRPGRD